MYTTRVHDTPLRSSSPRTAGPLRRHLLRRATSDEPPAKSTAAATSLAREKLLTRRGCPAARACAVGEQVAVNGRRLKEGPYTTVMRPARLDPGKSLLLGAGVRGAQPGEEQQLQLQLVNELDENMTTCSTSGEQVVGAVASTKCADLRADACRARADCEWLPVEGAVGAGVCNALHQHELVEIYLEPIVSVGGGGGALSASQPQGQLADAAADPASGAATAGVATGSAEEKKAGRVKSCDHGTYTLSYAMPDAGRYLLYVKVAGLDTGAPSRARAFLLPFFPLFFSGVPACHAYMHVRGREFGRLTCVHARASRLPPPCLVALLTPRPTHCPLHACCRREPVAGDHSGRLSQRRRGLSVPRPRHVPADGRVPVLGRLLGGLLSNRMPRAHGGGLLL